MPTEDVQQFLLKNLTSVLLTTKKKSLDYEVEVDHDKSTKAVTECSSEILRIN